MTPKDEMIRKIMEYEVLPKGDDNEIVIAVLAEGMLFHTQKYLRNMVEAARRPKFGWLKRPGE